MITAITVANFKGIAGHVRLELRPITLLFGMNSAGKSTLLHALHYAHEVIERHNLDADRTQAGGDAFDLGGFAALVHRHELMRSVVVGFDLDVSEQDLPVEEYCRPAAVARAEINTTLMQALSAQVQSASVKIAVHWNAMERRPDVIHYAVSINGHHLAAVRAGDGHTVELAEVNTEHPLFPSVFGSTAEEASALMGELAQQPWPLAGQDDALPDWDSCLDFDLPARDRPSELDLIGVLSMLIVGPGRLVRDALRSIRPIGPLRQVPPRGFAPPRRPDDSRWVNGLGAWDRLFHAGPALAERVSRLLADPDRLATRYELTVRDYRELDTTDRLSVAVETGRIADEDHLAARLAQLPLRRRIEFRPLDNPGLALEAADLGIGISQMLPLLVAALDAGQEGTTALAPQFVLIEQPELHIHPRLQAELGDVFIEGALSEATRGRVFLVETHSEHLTLRLLRRIRESLRGQSPLGIAVKPTDVGVWYVNRSMGAVELQQILVDVAGEFVQPWPEDDTLFEQDFRERYT